MILLFWGMQISKGVSPFRGLLFGMENLLRKEMDYMYNRADNKRDYDLKEDDDFLYNFTCVMDSVTYRLQQIYPSTKCELSTYELIE